MVSTASVGGDDNIYDNFLSGYDSSSIYTIVICASLRTVFMVTDILLYTSLQMKYRW